MKSLHRTKALAAYDGARITLKNGMVYPAYLMLKEAARGALAYIAEDAFSCDFSEKVKLHKLLNMMTEDLVSLEDQENIRVLTDIESGGLAGILALQVADLEPIKKTVKKLISTYLAEHV